MMVQREVYFSKWRLPQFWILKNCCHFFNIWPIFTKLSGNLGLRFRTNLLHCIVKKFKMTDATILNFGKRLSFLYYLTINTKVGILRLWYRIHIYIYIYIYVESKRLSNQNSSWLSPPSWLSKNSFYFFTIIPIIVNFSWNVMTTIRNIYMTFKVHCCNKNGSCTHLIWFR